MSKRLTPFRKPPKPTTPIGHIYKHIHDTMDANGVFSIQPLIGKRVYDSQTKLMGHMTTRQIHNKLDVFRKHYGMNILKLPEIYMFRWVPREPVEPVVDPYVLLGAVLLREEFNGVPMTKDNVVRALEFAKLRVEHNDQ